MMITLEEFKKEFSTILSSLELKRKRHLKFFYIAAPAAIALMFISLAYPAQILSAVLNFFDIVGRETGLLNTKKSAEMDAVPGTSDIASLIFLALLCSLWLILYPVYRYRGTNRSAALQTFRFHRSSLKDDAYSALFKLFGPFEFAPRGGISLVDTRNTTLFPDRTLLLPEDFVVGRLNDITVKFCEANIVRIENRARVSLFRGLMIVCDISELKVKLRRNFAGRTVLIYDPKKTITELATKYGAMQRMVLPEKFEPVLEGYSTDIKEAQRLITSELLELLDSFATYTQHLTQQVSHWDDRLAHAAAETYGYVKGKLVSTAARSRLPSEIAYDKEYKTAFDVTKSDSVSDDISSLNKHFELEFYDDKCIVTIPCRFDLFETNSIFEPALNSEDAHFIYNMMQTLDKLTKHLDQVMM